MNLYLGKIGADETVLTISYQTSRGTKRTFRTTLTDLEASKLAHRLMAFAVGGGRETELVIEDDQ